MIDILTYDGPFPVLGLFDPQTAQLDDSAAQPSHRLVSPKRLIPIASDDASGAGVVITPLAILSQPRTLEQRDDLVSVDPLAKVGMVAFVADGEISELQVWDGSNWKAISTGVLETEALEVISDNQVSQLTYLPLSGVSFSVNGIPTFQGITNVGKAVSINPLLVGYNISPLVDAVTAQYLR
jgi:hypothetical protein